MCWIVVISAVVSILCIWVVPMLSSVDPRLSATINIIFWAVVCIFVLYPLFAIMYTGT